MSLEHHNNKTSVMNFNKNITITENPQWNTVKNIFTILAHIGMKPLYSARKPSFFIVFKRQSTEEE